MLCAQCNTALGLVREEPRRIMALMRYLVAHHPEKREEAEKECREWIEE